MNGRTVATPIGPLWVEENGGALIGVRRMAEQRALCGEPSGLLDEAQRQLEAYFAGRLRTFDLPLCMDTGSAFDREVWRALCTIAYGEIRTYGALARQLCKPSASRAVGGACSRNPLLILVPCHRVVAGTGKLTGFAAGMDAKAALLEHEGHRVSAGRISV